MLYMNSDMSILHKSECNMNRSMLFSGPNIAFRALKSTQEQQLKDCNLSSAARFVLAPFSQRVNSVNLNLFLYR